MSGVYNKADDAKIRSAFPILNDETAYLDNAATTQKPECVIKAVEEYYRSLNANPLRGLYKLSVAATEAYEGARKTVADFIGAGDSDQIIFTRNTTESLNLVAYSYARNFLHEGDEILISIMEHHSNMIPWQQAAKATGAVLKYVDCDKQGKISREAFEAAITDKTKIVAMTELSNVLGTVNDVKTFAAIAHEHGAIFVCDGAQSVPHIPVNVTDLDVDFMAFSGHKMYSPMGIGVLYGKKDLLEKMPPFLFGGEMIDSVSRFDAKFSEIPHKFEGGTVNAGGAVGLEAAIRYIQNIGFDTIEAREKALTQIAMDKLKAVPHLHILGSDKPEDHHGILTFTIDGVHPHDVAYILDSQNVDIRAGHHCAQPLMRHFDVFSTSRASLSFYNTEDEIDRLVDAVSKLRGEMGFKD